MPNGCRVACLESMRVRELIAALQQVPVDVEVLLSLETGEIGFLVPVRDVRLAPVLRDAEVTEPRWYLPARAANGGDRTEEFAVILYPRPR